MAKKFNLAEYLPAEDATAPTMDITWIPIQKIQTNWKNFYSVDWQEQDLAESIEVAGLLTPLGVVRDGVDRYKLISGHRRLRALRYLHDSRPDGREKWADIPCVIYDTPEDADREKLMLIAANAQRVKTAQELAKEAAELTEILVRMKEAGAELPGRMRDRVAEALKISSTRLARLEAIKNNLTYPGWVRKWESQAINESVAYRLSQLDYSQQMNVADYIIDHDIKDKDVTLRVIEEALAHPPLTKPGCGDPLAYETDTVKVDRELARRAGFLSYYSGSVRFANRKDGMDQLKLTFRHAGHGSDDLDWDGEAAGIRFKKPIDHLIGWGALYDALAANALDASLAANDRPPVSKSDQPEPKAASEPPRPGWHRCFEVEPADGQTVILLIPGPFPVFECCVYRDGFYTEPDEPEDGPDVDSTMWWIPAPELPEEVRE